MSDQPSSVAELERALRAAKAHVYRQQHAGTHEQDRHDARKWMDEHGGGRCGCPRCIADARRATERRLDKVG